MRLKGVVEIGQSLGTKMFVPTMNLILEEVPGNLEYGVYACRAFVKEEWYNGVAHFGPRSTVDNLVTFEVNLFDFSEMVYGEEIEIDLLSKLREIQKFENFERLKEQIDIDVAEVKKILRNKYD